MPRAARPIVRALLAVLCCAAGPVLAAELALVVDDLGYNRKRAEEVLALPGPVTLAVLPFAPETPAIARRALATGHELILHQPMEALTAASGGVAIGTLTEAMSPQAFDADLDAALAAVPGIVGVNNHTGSRLTQDRAAMRRLMQALSARGLLFLDSRTTAATVAYATAREAGVPALKRDVFLDDVAQTDAIAGQFARALAIARRRGYAVVIAHPHPASLEFLARALATLPADVSLTTLRHLVDQQRPAMLAQPQAAAFPSRSPGP